MKNEAASPMAYYPVYIRQDQINDLKALKKHGYNPAQIIRVGLDKELEIKKQEAGK